jgi:hypothetical protein
LSSSRNIGTWIDVWNRKLHYYLALYLLWFIWLFAFSGLLLNHPKWTFANFWPNRKESTFEKSIQSSQERGDLAVARDLMRQLGLTGEVQWTTARPTAGRFDLTVVRPGEIIQVQTDFTKQVASVKQIQTNWWGVIHMMHTFTGVRRDDAINDRDWIVTKIWSFSMDAIVVGLIFLVLSSFYMGYQRRQKWMYQGIALALGILCCAFFIWGLNWV